MAAAPSSSPCGSSPTANRRSPNPRSRGTVSPLAGTASITTSETDVVPRNRECRLLRSAEGGDGVGRRDSVGLHFGSRGQEREARRVHVDHRDRPVGTGRNVGAPVLAVGGL